MAEIIGRVRNKIDTAANWTAANTLLLQGEIGIESDTNKIKIGDGTTRWNSLGYFGGSDTLATSTDITNIFDGITETGGAHSGIS